MKPISWVHTADLHLDEPMKRVTHVQQRRQEHRQTFQRIISLIKDRHIPFFFIAGDFLEHGSVTPSTVEFVKTCFKEIADTQILISPGNHDPFRKDSVYASEQWPENVHIFQGDWESISFPEYDLHIYGRGFTEFREPEWIAPPQVHSTGKKIMVVHGDFSSQDHVSSEYFPLRKNELAPLEMDYIALGHIHKAYETRLENRRKTLVRYPGSPEALSWKETGTRTITIGEMTDESLRIEEIPIQTRTYEKHFIDVSGYETVETLRDEIVQQTQSSSKESYHRFVLSGRRSIHLQLSEDTCHWLSQQLEELGFYSVVWEDETLPDFDLDYLRQQSDVIGAFIRLVEKRLAHAQTDVEREEYELALRKGLEALYAREIAT
ncbi:metallophosphoesterase family protein [Hazenella coriacea]|uniref:DNA repair exonuclease SbcCD nuclease subunit n=1 Tax=Hazenella coriacea TaxID=1179467 RepID=A0A4R3L680_9BACL|nr:DNA repair exonuclease [Hazenella coriacea]TCS94922.1 DNA repair exonuclease SbcCD nuclease subunit [Hazenella coriacea]